MICEHCGRWHYYPPHHKKYRSRGGSNDAKNMAYLCRECHDAVHRRPWIEWTAKFRTSRYQEEGESEEEL